MKTVRVNIRAKANTAAVRREKRNGRDVIVVPSATLPDGVVMNGIQYPAEEIEKGFMSLNRSPAPLGHPTVNGKFVSASDPEGINASWVGAWNENVRREGGRVFLDKVIDVERAGQSEGGKAVLNAIDKGEPIHTSTGLLLDLEPAPSGAGFKHIARNMLFDHDAILLGEEGAATPEQGVGMLVNAKGEASEIEVINSALDDADRELEWAADMALRAAERARKAPMIERIKGLIMDVVRSETTGSVANEEEADMADEKKLEELSAKVNGLSESMEKIGDTIAAAVNAAVKPLIDAQAELAANQKAKDDAEKAEMVEAVVKANLLEKPEAEELTLNALRALAKKAKPGKAAALNGAGSPSAGGDDEFADYSLNAHLEAK